MTYGQMALSGAKMAPLVLWMHVLFSIHRGGVKKSYSQALISCLFGTNLPSNSLTSLKHSDLFLGELVGKFILKDTCHTWC